MKENEGKAIAVKWHLTLSWSGGSTVIASDNARLKCLSRAQRHDDTYSKRPVAHNSRIESPLIAKKIKYSQSPYSKSFYQNQKHKFSTLITNKL